MYVLPSEICTTPINILYQKNISMYKCQVYTNNHKYNSQMVIFISKGYLQIIR